MTLNDHAKESMAGIALGILLCLALGACAMPVNAPPPIPSPHIDWRG